MTTDGPTTLARALRSFLSEHLPFTRGLSPHTVRSYRDAFVLLLPFLAERHSCTVVDLEFDHLGPRDLIAYLEHLETDRGVCASTRNSRLAAVRSFARFAATRHPERVETCQRLLAVPTKRHRIRTVDYLEAEEIRAMLDSVDRQNTWGRRDHALLLTLFNTGARVQELLGVRLADLQLDKPFLVRLRGKGRKDRVCPLWENTVESLRELLLDMPADTVETKPIFRSRRGDPLTRFGVRYIVRRYAHRAHSVVPSLAGKRVHPHTFRHSAAVHLLRSGVDLVTISQWLGHASIETTNRYAAIDLETKRQALERAGSIGKGLDPKLASWRVDPSILDWLEAL